MVKKTVAIDLQASTKGEESVKSLKSQIKDATNEATILAQKFGQFSPEAAKAAKKVAELKDQMDDFREQVQALHPDKFNRIATVVGGIANGIQAAQGAMALFGSESEDVQKALLKVQGAMAFAQGIEGLIAFKNQFKTLATLMKTQVVGAFTTVAGAARMVGGALGIGLVITAVTALINNFEKVKVVGQKLVNFFPVLGTVVRGLGAAWNWLKEKVTAATDAMGITNSKLDEQTKKLQTNIDAQKRAAEIEEAQGKDTYSKRRKILEDELKLLQMKNSKEEDLVAKRHEIILLDTKHTVDAEKEKQGAYKETVKVKELTERELEDIERKKRGMMTVAQREELIKRQENENQKNALITGGAANMLAFLETENKKIEKEIGGHYTRTREKANANFEKTKQQTADEIALKKTRNEAIQQLENIAFNSTQSVLGDIADLIGRQTAAGKIAALAEVGISEGRALAGALANTQSLTADNAITGGLAGVAKFLVIAASITSTAVRARNIIKGGGGAGGVQSVRVAPPNVVPTTSGILPDREDAGTFAGSGRVYVLEGDITDKQGRVRMLRNTSVV